MEDLTEARHALVRRLVERGDLRSGAVIEAFRRTPRHLFLPEVAPADAYADEAIVTKFGPGGRPLSSSSQPAIMAIMLEQLEVRPGQRVLEIGAGTGYNAALLAHLVGEEGAGGSVITLDIDGEVVDRARRNLAVAGVAAVTVVCADGADGWPEAAPYDRIVLTVGAADIPPAWTEQLTPDGRLVLPLSMRNVQASVAFERAGDHLESVSLADCGFMPMRGALAGRSHRRSWGGLSTDGLRVSAFVSQRPPAPAGVTVLDLGHARLWLDRRG